MKETVVDKKFRSEGDKAQVEVMFVQDPVAQGGTKFVRVRFRSKAKSLCHIISSMDIIADQPKKQIELQVARAGGALCEKHCEKNFEVIDPSEAAASAVEGYRRLLAMVRNEAPKPSLIIH